MLDMPTSQEVDDETTIRLLDAFIARALVIPTKVPLEECVAAMLLSPTFMALILKLILIRISIRRRQGETL